MYVSVFLFINSDACCYFVQSYDARSLPSAKLYALFMIVVVTILDCCMTYFSDSFIIDARSSAALETSWHEYIFAGCNVLGKFPVTNTFYILFT